MLEDKLPNISVTKIQVNTNFKPQIEGGEDFRTEAIKAFHNAVHYIIEKYLTENDGLEQNIIELMGDRGELPKDVKEFMDLGQISIQIIEEQSVDVKQKDLDEDEVKIHLFGKKIKIDKNQRKLTEVDSSQPLDTKQEGDNGVPPTNKDGGF
jgi:hypothetical protein